MENTAYIVLCILFALVWTLRAIGSVHIFQLNSYKPQVQKKWIYDHMTSIVPRVCWLVIIVPLTLKLGAVGMLLSCLICAVVAFLNYPKKAKKPLVYTARVKRLLICLAVLHAALVALSFFLSEYRDFCIMLFVLAAVCEQYIVLTANFIMSPVEKGINRHYISDAKRILAGMPKLKVIGVTGSYGKTSVKMFLGKLLAAKYNVLVTPGSYNTTLGVVRTVREKLRASHEVFVCEMGARNPGDIREICDIVKPTAGIITAIGEQHLESFKTIDNIISTKFELADALPADGQLFLNGDNEFIRSRETAVKPVYYRLVQKGERAPKGVYCAYDLRVSARGSGFKLREPDGTVSHLETKLIGEHNVLNITGAVAVARTLGVPMRDLIPRVALLESVPHRLELVGGGACTIIDDAYNSNPAGAKAALGALSAFDAAKIIVTPGMVELGARQEELNRELGAEAAGVCDYIFLVGKKQAEPIRAGAKAAGFAEGKIKVFDTVTEAIAAAKAVDTKGRPRVILLENDLPDNY